MKTDAEGSVWRKINRNTAQHWNTAQQNGAFPLQPNQRITSGEYSYYQQDSIRIYLNNTDTLLNRLVSDGFIQGRFIFPSFPGAPKQRMYANPTKNMHLGWYGYHFYFGSLTEVKIKMPTKTGQNIHLYKDYRLSFTYSGQPYVGPVNIRFSLLNETYTFNQKDVSLDMFLKGAKTVAFYQSGVEI